MTYSRIKAKFNFLLLRLKRQRITSFKKSLPWLLFMKNFNIKRNRDHLQYIYRGSLKYLFSKWSIKSTKVFASSIAQAFISIHKANQFVI
jgi:hypothetical protein